MDAPLVSIVMAVKDTAVYLPECINSIIAQTYTNWELVIANDHSTDNSWEVLRSYAEKESRIRLIQSDGYRLIPALQSAYRNISGELVNRMDSDDKMPFDKLEVLVGQWEQYGKGHVIAGGTKHFVDQGTVGGGFMRYDAWLNQVADECSHFENIYQECVIPSHCWIMHKSDFDDIGAFDPLVYPEDYDLTFRIYKNNLKVMGINKILHFWRDRSNRISRTWTEYKDNRYFNLKITNFYAIDRERSRELVVWGAGRNGKDLIKEVLQFETKLRWVCGNPKKIGKSIYGLKLESCEVIPKIHNPQLIIAISSPDDKKAIKNKLVKWDKLPVRDYWFFS